jgi:hypothetical protein
MKSPFTQARGRCSHPTRSMTTLVMPGCDAGAAGSGVVANAKRSMTGATTRGSRVVLVFKANSHVATEKKSSRQEPPRFSRIRGVRMTGAAYFA